MGAWGTGSFDNDTACDWSYELEETTDLSLVKQTLAQVLEIGEDYLDADLASSGLAACEVIARLRGKGGVQNSYTETVDKLVASHPIHVPPDVIKQTLFVIDRILSSQSELLELWEESEDAKEWRESVADLRARVAS